MFSAYSCFVFVVVALFVQNPASSVDVEQPIVKTSTATFYGKRLDLQPHQLPVDYHGSVSVFTRIPYAEPPVGQLRFTSPIAKVIQGDFDATRPSVVCPQERSELWEVKPEQSEDCLTLDVLVPNPKPHNAAVMMWIHGGGYHIGGGSLPGQLPAPLAAFNDVIVVTINYRLGALGFMTTGDGSIPANIGLLDQRQALIWIQDNIEAFGGDPARVTIFGESAGSASINFHLLSTMSAGLFSRAIMQSGASTKTWSYHSNMAEAVRMSSNVAKAVGCDVETTSELVRCLRRVPVKDLIEVEGISRMSSELFVHPVADGQFLPDDPINMASAGRFNQVDVIIGCMANEGSYRFIPDPKKGQEGTTPHPMNHTEFRHTISRNLGTDDPITLDIAEQLYASPDESKDDANFVSHATALIGQAMFLCPTFDLSAELSRAGRNVYPYLMSHVPSFSIWGSKYDWLGATHVEDITYVFGAPFMGHPDDDDWKMTGRFGNDQEVEMSLQIMRYWSNFAKTGDPNLSTEGEEAGSKYQAWSRYNPSATSYKELNPTFENREGTPKSKECYFIKNLVPKLIANAEEMAHLKSLLEDKVREDSTESCHTQQSCPEQ
ncbi:cholinesterase 1-like isoform X2 [Lytechinus variegatus]|uniref:cholinesterase 1-like isoform X2 n=1 Tax=Lytechinus variegatus TaxID=7654 RepID=UPI001BB1C9AA|nr:cholinesterase 1-like isoform X2 [Lytechinus variegatus]